MGRFLPELSGSATQTLTKIVVEVSRGATDYPGDPAVLRAASGIYFKSIKSEREDAIVQELRKCRWKPALSEEGLWSKARKRERERNMVSKCPEPELCS